MFGFWLVDFLDVGTTARPKLFTFVSFEEVLPTLGFNPTFLANAGFLATAAMKLCCFLLVDGMSNLNDPAFADHKTHK